MHNYRTWGVALKLNGGDKNITFSQEVGLIRPASLFIKCFQAFVSI